MKKYEKYLNILKKLLYFCWCLFGVFCVYIAWQFKKTGFEPWMPIDMLFSVGIVASILNFLALKKNFRLSIKIVRLGLNLPFVLSLVLIFSILFSSNKPPQLIPLDDTRGSYTLRKRGSDYFVKYIPSGDKKTFIDCPLIIGCEVGAIGGNWFGQFVDRKVNITGDFQVENNMVKLFLIQVSGI